MDDARKSANWIVQQRRTTTADPQFLDARVVAAAAFVDSSIGGEPGSGLKAKLPKPVKFKLSS
jgi:hypothetical protein